MARETPQNDAATEQARSEKITTGANDRPKNEPIGQTGAGLPDDSGEPIEIDPEEEKRIADKIRST